MGTGIPNVPYAAITQGMQDTIAGRTQLIILLNATAGPLIRRGDVKALAQTSARRLPGFDDVPAVAETWPGFDFTGWFSIAAPAGTPEGVVTRLNLELDRILKDPEIVARLRDLSVYTEGADTPQGTRAFIASEIDRYGQIVKAIGVVPE
jgi:tripartite-type tricarboxylate transporter receptor subunit TctC